MIIPVGPIIGIIGAIVISWCGHLYKNWQRREHLRKAFLSELEHPFPEGKAWAGDLESGGVPKKELIPTTIYKTNALNISILSAKEIERLVEYYSHVTSFKEEEEKFRQFRRKREKEIDFSSENNKDQQAKYQERKKEWGDHLSTRYDKLKTLRQELKSTIKEQSTSFFGYPK